MNSQKYFTFKELDKYTMVEVRGIKSKKITNEPLAILFLGRDTTLIVSHNDPISKLLLTKAHLRNTQNSLHPIHTTAATTLSRLMTEKFGILLTYSDDMIQSHILNCVTCRKNRLLHYVSPVGMSDTRMLPTMQPMSLISMDPIMSWPIQMADGSNKKFLILVVLCRQTGFVWYEILMDLSTRSLTIAQIILQCRFGKISHILSDRGSNMIPGNLNPTTVIELVHGIRACPNPHGWPT